MTVHVISVGISILESLASPRECEALGRAPDLVQRIQRASPDQFLTGQGITGPGGQQASGWLASALTPAGQPGRDERRAAELKRLCAEIQPERWPSELSAELDTFARASAGGARLGRRDIAVLVSSDTAAGLGAGLWNAAALVAEAPGDLGRVRYLATADESPGDVRGHAMLVRVDGLDASADEGFRTAMRGLGLLGRHLLDSGAVRPAEPFRFYLSGGFKAAIPYLIGLAEGLRSLDPERDIAAYVLHDTTGSAPIRLPLRRLLPDVVRAHLAGFSTEDGARDDKPSGAAALLEGYAYEPDGRRWRLTPFGEGLSALFGPGPEGLLR